jgi:hypothetical protein
MVDRTGKDCGPNGAVLQVGRSRNGLDADEADEEHPSLKDMAPLCRGKNMYTAFPYA